MLKKLKTNPFALILWIMISCLIHIVLFRAKVNPVDQIWQRILTTILAFSLTLLMHECLHFVFMKVFCKGKVRIIVAKGPLGFPTLGTVAQAEFQPWQTVLIYLAPFVFLTLLVDFILMFCVSIELFFFLVSICNCAGCFYDLVDALIAAKKN